MVVAEKEICQITEDVWTSVLGLGVQLDRGARPATRLDGSLVGCVQITGAWEGAVTVESSPVLARRATAILLGVAPDSATLEEVRDTLGELANIIGGNIKSMLPGPSQLSLPAVIDGNKFELTVPGSALLSVVAFECDGQPLRVAILKRNQVGSPPGSH